MTFFELNFLNLAQSEASYLEVVGNISRANAPSCADCGVPLGRFKRIPPFKYKVVRRNLCDLISEGGAFAVSPRFMDAFVESPLRGLEFWDEPIELTNSDAIYYMAQPAYTRTLIDVEASGAVISKVHGCDKCGKASYKKTDRIVIREESWEGEDVFFLSSLSGPVLVTQAFVDFVDVNRFSNFSYIHQDDYHFDDSYVYDS
jgi:hypothetical protein